MLHTAAVPLIIGADVGCTEIVPASAEPSRVFATVLNEPEAIRAWLGTLPAHSIIGMEATGSYHRCLADEAAAMGFTVYVLNPGDVAHYARGLGQRGKTDGLDARVIARYVAHERRHLYPYRPPTERQRELATLLQQRATLVRHTAALAQSLRMHRGLERELDHALGALRALIAAIEQRLRVLIDADAALKAHRQRLATIDGVGRLVSVLLVQRFERVPYPNSDAAVAGFGLDPRPNDSGKRVGVRKLSKRGNPEARRLAYMAAMSAARSQTWKPHFDSLLARGLPKTAAYCALARKIIRVAFAIWRTAKPFDPSLIGTP